MWMSVCLLPVNMEVAVRILSTLISVCVPMDSQVGEPSHQGFHLLYQKNTPCLAVGSVFYYVFIYIKSVLCISYSVICFHSNPSLSELIIILTFVHQLILF